MNANDVIESYVNEVALQLPRKQRDDVAFELRALLDEGLQARAEESGRVADAEMALEWVRAFGRPAEVAARYRPALTIIDPADGHAFLRASVIGLAIIWCLGLVSELQHPIDSVDGLLIALGHWWTTVVIASMWWPGVLVVSFGVASWTRRRWPETSEWKPRAAAGGRGNRVAMGMGVIATLLGLVAILDPRWVLGLIPGGRVAPAAVEALTYTDSFRQLQAPYVFVLLALNVPMMLAAIAHGRWPATMRFTRNWQSLATCAVMAWIVLDGPVFMAPSSDRMVKQMMSLMVAITLIGMAMNLRRSVRPTPSRRIQA